MKLIERIEWAHQNLEFKNPKYAIVWNRNDGGTSVTVPSPEFIAMATHGGLLPAIEVYHEMKCRWVNDKGAVMLTQVNESPGEGWREGKVLNGELMHSGPRAPAMSEEEAMEYLLQKDVPRYVWFDHDRSNSRQFLICPRECVPANRVWRNVWEINQELHKEAA